MPIVEVLLLAFLVACALVAVLNPSIMGTILTYMGFSVVMSVIWIILEAPDLAITEAAVGAGVSTVLYFLTLRKIRELKQYEDSELERIQKEKEQKEGQE